MLTFKELKEFVEKNNIDENTPIIVTSSNIEMRRNMVDAHVMTLNVSKQSQNFVDEFDGTRYTSKVYVMDDNGEKCIYINN